MGGGRGLRLLPAELKAWAPPFRAHLTHALVLQMRRAAPSSDRPDRPLCGRAGRGPGIRASMLVLFPVLVSESGGRLAWENAISAGSATWDWTQDRIRLGR